MVVSLCKGNVIGCSVLLSSWGGGGGGGVIVFRDLYCNHCCSVCSVCGTERLRIMLCYVLCRETIARVTGGMKVKADRDEVG